MFRTAAVPGRLSLIVLFALLLAGCSGIEKMQTQRRVQASIDEADRQLTLGHEVAARKWLDTAIALDPHSVDTYISFDDDGDVSGGVITCLASHSDWPDMVTYLTAAVKDPKIAASYLIWENLADAQDSLGQKDEAKASYAEELKQFGGGGLTKGSIIHTSESTNLLLHKAIATWGSGDHIGAAAIYQHIIERYPDQAIDAQNTLAYSEAEANENLPQAFTLASQAVSSARGAALPDEELSPILDTLAWVEFKMHRISDAARDEEEAVAYVPREPVLHYHLACIYQASGDISSARIEIVRASVLGPYDVDTEAALKVINAPPTAKTQPAIPSPTSPAGKA